MDTIQRRRRLEQLYAAHAPAVHAYCRRRVPESAADDAVSEVFLTVWRRIDDVPAAPLPWLLTCARNVLLHQHRRTVRDEALFERLSGTLTREPAGDPALARALGRLTPRDQEILLLVAWEGLTAAEAARVLGCSRGTLAVRLHRARKRLAAALDHPDPGRPATDRSPSTQEVV